jgi:mono/diheme cytochrome c family protein
VSEKDLSFMIVKRLAAPRIARDQGWFMESQDNSSMRQPTKTNHLIFLAVAMAGMLALATAIGCDAEPRKSDAELGLNPQQSAGRRIYDAQCDRCHEPYSKRGKKGPSLKGVFQNKYLSLSGLPANDERISDIVRLGRNEMPGYAQTLSAQDIQDLLAYLHTL